MRVLVAQPNHESGLEQLLEELQQQKLFDAVLYPEGYVTDENGVAVLCDIAKQYNKLVITGYRDRYKKDRALMIHPSGKIILERAKSPMNEPLYSPSVAEADDLQIGYLLCVEILQGLMGLEGQAEHMDFIAHPIGVGMFSEAQFAEWIETATMIALKYKTVIIGTSHADGSYRNCGISIPISYCIDASGQPLYISQNDPRSWIIDLKTGQVDRL
ncbi:hypothetical protein H1230_10005 [Paenibacillus sp. 19GGS1-52]|uniref:hypothetical protein n=1 Tax=Paenibacillus sp. 19GGS1-52 TaxID=2758563 RepID=UPI001EFA7936|nr:hypothetical protein [Paenibacillus sp. 19GGS1-52]ULO09066.1 hypothetical protein H1230_10005 [Paenibacillus sp. 19GGS1-52]